MLSRSLHRCRGGSRTVLASARARLSHNPDSPSSAPTRRRSAIAVAAGGALLAGMYLKLRPTPAQDDQPVPPIQSAPPLALARTYLVFTCCAIPAIVDNSTRILETLTRSPVPGVAALTNAIVRRTFFAQFVAGESVADCRPKMADLRARGVGTLLNYAAEAGIDEGKELDPRELEVMRFNEVEKAIVEAGAFETAEAAKGVPRGSTMFALKITGLIEPAVLERASSTILRLRAARHPQVTIPYPGGVTDDDALIVAPTSDADDPKLLALAGPVSVTGVLATDNGLAPGDLRALQLLWGKLKYLGQLAHDNGIKILIDAEHSWYQPAIDAYSQALSVEFNRVPADGSQWNGPLIYYVLDDTLPLAIKHAQDQGYALGVKLVRGAYFVQERAKWRADGRPGPDPIWPDKPTTDRAFNESVQTLLSTLGNQISGPRPDMALSVVFGTHNTASVQEIIDALQQYGIARRDASGRLCIADAAKGRVTIGQLYGMKDDLMDLILTTFCADGHPVAAKYVAYAKLSQVIPFLGRRATENKSLLSGAEGAGAERRRVVMEVKRRLFG